jgi:Ca2+:H+ antiporter
LLAFIFSYLAIIPCANLIGFSGGQLTHKLPHVWGLALNTL